MGRPRKIKIEDVVKVDEVDQVPQGEVIEESVEITLPDGECWVKVSEEQVRFAEELGVLAGFDPLTMTALISKGEENVA